MKQLYINEKLIDFVECAI